jgi:hypothetical protein
VFSQCFTLYKLLAFDATPAAQSGNTISIAALYPFNSKFGSFDKLPVIYPEHYEPD